MMESSTEKKAVTEKDCLVLKKRDISAYENCLSNGYKAFIEQCSFSLSDNNSNYSSDEIRKFLYIFKFLNDQWSVTNRVIRSLKKEILQVLFLLLLSKKTNNKNSMVINRIGALVENNWLFRESEFPYIDEKEEKDISNQLPLLSPEVIESDFTNLNFIKKILANDTLIIVPELLEELKRTFIKFGNHLDEYDAKSKLLLKTIFIGIVDECIPKSYPGITIILPIRYLLNEIDKINKRTFKVSSALATCKQVSFNDSEPCYITERVYIKNASGKYRPPPDWAIWFFKAGENMASLGQKKKNVVLGFSLPTRSYAALFFLLGYETRTAVQSMKDRVIDTEYFLAITRMEKKAPLLIWDKDRWKRCYAQGVKTVYGKEMFSVSVPGTENKRHDRLVPMEHVHIFRKAVHPERKVGDHQLGYSMRGFEFFRNYYKKKDEDLLKYLITTKSKFTVIGNKTILKNEASELPINIRQSKDWMEGSMLDIIRFDNYLFSEFDLSRGTILSSEEVNNYNFNSNLVIFDGSLSFLKHYEDIEGDTKVIFLDRSESQFAEACRVIMEQNYSDRENQDDMILYDTMPETIESIMFEE